MRFKSSLIYAEYFDNYIKLVPDKKLVDVFNEQQPVIEAFFKTINEDKAGYTYAPGKWTLKTLLKHLCDTERIMTYRMLAIARGEKQPLPGFDENAYAANSYAENQTWDQLIAELLNIRKSTQTFIKSLDESRLNAVGTASGKEISVAALGYIMVGHIYHHINIIKERYIHTP